MKPLNRLPDERFLTLMGLVAWSLAVATQVATRNTALAGVFVTAGTMLLLTRGFYRRMGGTTKVGVQGIETDLQSVVDVHARAEEQAPGSSIAGLDPSTLVARWPTLDDALKAIPLSWTTERVPHDDGNEYIHVRSPQAGYELRVNVAALDSAAPQWLMAAIAVMEATS